MRKIFAIFAAVCFAANMTAALQEEPVVVSVPDTTIIKTAYSFTLEGITVSATQGSVYPANHSYNNYQTDLFSCLANSSITFSATQTIKGIAIDGVIKKEFDASVDHGDISYVDASEYEMQGSPVVVVRDIDATSVTISCVKQLCCFSVKVYFSENPEAIEEVLPDTVHITATTAVADDYSDDPAYSSEGSYSYWLKLAPADNYPEVWLDLYTAEKGEFAGEYSLYNSNLGFETYVWFSDGDTDGVTAYDGEISITKNESGYHIEGWVLCYGKEDFDPDMVYDFVYDGAILIKGINEEGVDEVYDTSKVIKIIRDGQLIIVRDGKEYNAQGACL